MKRTRKGFTLVELLIVIAILGSLSAMMTNSMGNATASAKASAIVSNISAAKQAGVLYYSNHMYDDQAVATTVAFTNADLVDYIDIASFASTNTRYKATGTVGIASANTWAICCDFTNEPDKDEIAKILHKNPVISSGGLYTAADPEDENSTATYAYMFKVNVLNGKAEALASWPTD